MITYEISLGRKGYPGNSLESRFFGEEVVVSLGDLVVEGEFDDVFQELDRLSFEIRYHGILAPGSVHGRVDHMLFAHWELLVFKDGVETTELEYVESYEVDILVETLERLMGR